MTLSWLDIVFSTSEKEYAETAKEEKERYNKPFEELKNSDWFIHKED